MIGPGIKGKQTKHTSVKRPIKAFAIIVWDLVYIGHIFLNQQVGHAQINN